MGKHSPDYLLKWDMPLEEGYSGGLKWNADGGITYLNGEGQKAVGG